MAMVPNSSDVAGGESSPAVATHGLPRRCPQARILRQAGAVYQFRHIELQHRLATTADPSLWVFDRVPIDQIIGTVLSHTKERELTPDEEAAAVAALRERAGGRTDLLAEVAGMLEDHSEGEEFEPVARQVAILCRASGADPDAIPAWIEEGQRRRAGGCSAAAISSRRLWDSWRPNKPAGRQSAGRG